MPQGSLLIISNQKRGAAAPALSFKAKKVSTCFSGDALGEIDRQDANVAVLDCGIDVGSGLELLKEIKESYPAVPVIFLTDLSSEETALRAFNAGARLYFKAPFNVSVIQGAINELLKVTSRSRENRSPFMVITRDKSGETTVDAASIPASILQVIRYVEENFSENITLETLAREACLSKFHFSRIFKSYMGVSPMKFVFLRRMDRARFLLEKSNFNISEISLKVGFNDLGHFGRQFKALAGVSPSGYRNEYQKRQARREETAVEEERRGAPRPERRHRVPHPRGDTRHRGKR